MRFHITNCGRMWRDPIIFSWLIKRSRDQILSIDCSSLWRRRDGDENFTTSSYLDLIPADSRHFVSSQFFLNVLLSNLPAISYAQNSLMFLDAIPVMFYLLLEVLSLPPYLPKITVCDIQSYMSTPTRGKYPPLQFVTRSLLSSAVKFTYDITPSFLCLPR
jgi:hypothetical protein